MAHDLEARAKEAFIDDHFDLAADLYTQAIVGLDLKKAELYSDLAQAYIKVDNFPEAVANANKAIELDPSMSKAYLRKGMACVKLKEYQTAKKALEKGGSLAAEDSRFTSLIKECDQCLAGAQRPTYPSSKGKAQDWDKLEPQVKGEEKEEQLDGDVALNEIFRDFYLDAVNNPNPMFNASFGERNGIDYDDIFSLVVKLPSLRVVLALAANLNLEIEELVLDVKTVPLCGEMEKEIYMRQHQGFEGFELQSEKNPFFKLEKSLYGYQVSWQWYHKIDSFMVGQNFRKTESDQCVYIKRYSDGDLLILLLYVNHVLIVGHDTKRIVALKSYLCKSFSMKDLAPAELILGMKIYRDRKNKKLWLSQEKYIEQVLDMFNMSKAKPVGTPLANHFKLSTEQCPTSKEEADYMMKVPYASAVENLMYVMMCTRPDIAHAVGVVSRFLSNPGKQHWEAVKRIFRYLRGTTHMCLCYGEHKPLSGYSDADWGGDLDSGKSTSGYMISYAGGGISWKSELQDSVSLSPTEAKYIALYKVGKEIVWMKTFFQELGLEQKKFVLFCDQSLITLCRNLQLHSRIKHVDLRYHWIRDVIEEKVIDIEKVHIDDNSSDMMTRSLLESKFEFCISQAGLAENPN